MHAGLPLTLNDRDSECKLSAVTHISYRLFTAAPCQGRPACRASRWTPPGQWRMNRHRAGMRHSSVSPLDHSPDLETSLSTGTEPWTNGWPSDHQSASLQAPRHPMITVLPVNHAQDIFRSPCTHRPWRSCPLDPLRGACAPLDPTFP